MDATARALGLVVLALPATARAAVQCDPVEVAKLKAAVQVDAGHFGAAAAVDGSLALVGSPGDDLAAQDGGAAYLHARDQGGPLAWGRIATLVASDAGADDAFGSAVALAGDVALAGAPLAEADELANTGAVYVFERDAGGPGNWGEVQRLDPSPLQENSRFGIAVALEGQRLAVGATEYGPTLHSGSVFVFERDALGGTWSQTARLDGGEVSTYLLFGNSVALSGDLLVVGAPDWQASTGTVYVYERGPSGSWDEVDRLIGPASTLNHRFGWSVDVAGEAILVGRPQSFAYPLMGGRADLFERLGGSRRWSPTEVFLPPALGDEDELGWSVTLDGDTAGIGAPGRNSGRGAIWVYARDEGGPGNWGKVAHIEPALTVNTKPEFGTAVALSGTTLLVGAPGDQGPGGPPDAGRALVYEGAGGSPPASYCTAGTSASGCRAVLSASGTPSATAPTGFVVSAAGVEGGKDGLFFFGTGGRQANPWGNGTSYQCVVPPVKRGGLLPGSGTLGACDGALSQDLNALWCPACPKPAHNPGAGALVQVQLWYRDPLSTSSATTSLSDALELTVCF